MEVIVKIVTDRLGDVEVERETPTDRDEMIDGTVIWDSENPAAVRDLIQQAADQAKLAYPDKEA